MLRVDCTSIDAQTYVVYIDRCSDVRSCTSIDAEVTEGGAADNAGIKKGDIIVKLDGQKVSGKDDLVDKLQYYEAGETIEVVISRANSGEYKEQTVEVTLGSKPSSDK